MSKFALFVILIFVSAIVAAIAVGPAWAFYLYEFMYWMNPANRWWGSDVPRFGYSFVIVATMALSFLIHRKQHMNNLIRDMPEFKWFIAFLLSFVVATFLAVNEAIHLRFLELFINMNITMFLAYRVIDTERKLEIALLVCLVGASYVGYEALQVGRDSFGRVEGIGTLDAPDSNTLSASMVPCIPIVIYFVWQGDIKQKIVAALTGVFILNGIILINSRGAFLGVVMGSGYLIWNMAMSKYKLPGQRMVFVLIVVAGILVSLRLFDATFWDRMSTIQGQTLETEGSGARRINFWLATLEMLKDYPLGVGIYGFETLSPVYLNENWLAQEYGMSVRSVHSIWFQVLGEVGWHGMVIFLMLLFTLYKHAKKAKSMLAATARLKQYYMIVALEGAILGYLVSSSFINMLRLQMTYWTMLFLICACVIFINRCNGEGEKHGSKSDEGADKVVKRKGIY